MKIKTHTILFIAGAISVVTPFLGIPQMWRSVLVFISGVAVLYVGYGIYGSRKEAKENSAPTFVENKNISNSNVGQQ